MTDVFTMSARVERSLNPRRAPMFLSLGFGGVALLLAAIGLYGCWHPVDQRTREIGIRMALGSQPSGILRLVLGEGSLWLVALGLAGGLAGALALRSAIASQLYGVGALDPRVLMGRARAWPSRRIACLGPACRAARVSPLVALSCRSSGGGEGRRAEKINRATRRRARDGTSP